MKDQPQYARQEQMFQKIEEFNCSGKTRKAYCSEMKIAVSKFYYWQRKFREHNEGLPNGMFLSIKTNGKSKWDQITSREILLQYPNGVSLHIPFNVPISMIRALISLI